MLLSMLRGHVGETAAPLIFLVLFLVIVGGSLWITPRLARWMYERAAKHKGYFDDMLTEDPNRPNDSNHQEKPSEKRRKS